MPTRRLDEFVDCSAPHGDGEFVPGRKHHFRLVGSRAPGKIDHVFGNRLIVLLHVSDALNPLRPADGHFRDEHARHAHANGNALTVLSTGPAPVTEPEVRPDELNLRQCLRSIADQVYRPNRSRNLSGSMR